MALPVGLAMIPSREVGEGDGCAQKARWWPGFLLRLQQLDGKKSCMLTIRVFFSSWICSLALCKGFFTGTHPGLTQECSGTFIRQPRGLAGGWHLHSSRFHSTTPVRLGENRFPTLALAKHHHSFSFAWAVSQTAWTCPGSASPQLCTLGKQLNLSVLFLLL